VPATLLRLAVRVIATDEAERIWRNHSVCLCRVPAKAAATAGLPAGTLWPTSARCAQYPRRHLAAVDTELWRTRALSWPCECLSSPSLDHSTHASRAQDDLVLYCLRLLDSWKTRPALAGAGYSDGSAWYPDGTDGWLSLRLPRQMPNTLTCRPEE